nr:MAG TPA: hypothetical protein [Caudoviricetes sp.]
MIISVLRCVSSVLASVLASVLVYLSRYVNIYYQCVSSVLVDF